MNHLMCISYRSSCCWLHRSQSLLSTLSSEIQIPPRIERKPTDILRALERTVLEDPIRTRYIFHDDPYLIPTKKLDYNIFALSYKSGKDTAMWIHKEHANLFPKDLSVPRIKAFVPQKVCKDKSEASEEALLQAIAETNVSNALNIYDLLDGDVSNAAKQSLLELLCFTNGKEDVFQMISTKQWFFNTKLTKIWTPNAIREELYNFLITQDSVTVSKAHNAMICGYMLWKKFQEAWLLFQHCQINDIPLNINTYNYIITVLPMLYRDDNLELESSLYNILRDMNDKKIAPNVRTLNAALSVASSISDIITAESLAKHLLIEFKRINIKFSLATYDYAISIFTRAGDIGYGCFMDILNSVAQQSFTMQDVEDARFFITAIDTAFYTYRDKVTGQKVFDFLFTGDNYKFLYDFVKESAFFHSYLLLMLSTNTLQDFFKHYQKIVPYFYVPNHHIFKEILTSMEVCSTEEIAECLPRFWSDIDTLGNLNSDISMLAMQAMSRIVSQVQPSTKAVIASAAKTIWEHMKKEMVTLGRIQISTGTVASIAIILLKSGDAESAMNILTYAINNFNSFVPTMTRLQVDELFELCISGHYFTEALLVLEYSINVGFQHTMEMAKTLYDNKENLTNDELEKLQALMKDDVGSCFDNQNETNFKSME
nr:protein PTCD3 homolog, mitochondrial [Megalopta genalis]XP_033324845.1 protein PTCD3 homolog, mitochondrial [Megalopta genalis]